MPFFGNINILPSQYNSLRTTPIGSFCDIDDITNAVSFADYSSCDGKGSGQVCTPVCVPGTGPVTNASEPIHLVCDADGDFTDPIVLTGPAVANVARLIAPVSNSTAGTFALNVVLCTSSNYSALPSEPPDPPS